MAETIRSWIAKMNKDHSLITAYAFVHWLTEQKHRYIEPISLLIKAGKTGINCESTAESQAYLRAWYAQYGETFVPAALPNLWITAAVTSVRTRVEGVDVKKHHNVICKKLRCVGFFRIRLAEAYLKLSDIEKSLVRWELDHYCGKDLLPNSEVPRPSKVVSKFVLKSFAKTLRRPLKTMLYNVERYMKHGITWTGTSDFEVDMPDGFWVHYCNYTGADIDKIRPRESFYSCSC